MPVDSSFILTHASGLHSVARKLDALHQEAIHAADGGRGAVRLPVLNLVAACTSVEDADVASHAVGQISQHHPTRAIIIFADPAQADSIEADLSLQRALSMRGDVNAEHVRLNVYGEPAYHLASVVGPLLVPDIPVFLWLVGAPPLRQAFGHDAVAIAERIIIDSGEYDDAAETLKTLAEEIGQGDAVIGLADLAWNRSHVWREVIAHAFDGPQMRPFVNRITRIEVESCGRRPSAQAWLCAGWLSDRLGWRSEGGPYILATAAEADGVPEHELTAIRLSCVDKEHSATVSLERRDDILYSTLDVDGGITASRTVSVDTPEISDLVSHLLTEGSEDPVYIHALRRAAALAQR